MLGFVVTVGCTLILLAAIIGAVTQKKGKKITGAISSILFIYTSSLTISLAQLVAAHGEAWHMSRVEDVLLAFCLGPPFAAFVLAYYGLYVALITAIILLTLTIAATRRFSARAALVVALCLGFPAPFAATSLQLGWSNFAISRGAEKLAFDCLDRPSLWNITQEVTLDNLLSAHPFSSPHAIGRKGDRVWLWSFRAGAWVESDPAHLHEHVDPRTIIRCSD